MATLDLTEHGEAVRGVLPASTPWRIEVGARLKYARLEMDAGALVVRIPPTGIEPGRLARFVAQHGPRMLDTATEGGEMAKQLVGGEGFVLLGRPYRLKLVDDGPACAIRRQPIGQRRPDGSGSMGSEPFLCLRRGQATAATVIGWYRGELLAWLGEQIPPLASRLGVRDGLTWAVSHHRDGVRVGSWARYYPGKHHITVSWQVAQFPRHLAKHVLRHEMCHAARPQHRPGGSGRTHGREWQSLMGTLHPQWRETERTVRKTMRVWTGSIATPADPAPFVSGWTADALV
jgi:predicted metal-dependent hydrolase